MLIEKEKCILIVSVNSKTIEINIFRICDVTIKHYHYYHGRKHEVYCNGVSELLWAI